MKKIFFALCVLFIAVGPISARTFVFLEDPPRPITGQNTEVIPDFQPPRPRIVVDPEIGTVTITAPSAQVTLVNLFTGETRHADVQGFYVVSDLPSRGLYLISVSGAEEVSDSVLAVM